MNFNNAAGTRKLFMHVCTYVASKVNFLSDPYPVRFFRESSVDGRIKQYPRQLETLATS